MTLRAPTCERRCRTQSTKASCNSMHGRCWSGMAYGRLSPVGRNVPRAQQPNGTFAAVHHRETVQRLRENKTDAGIVWKTEVAEALRQDAQVSSYLWRIASAMRSDMRSALSAMGSTGRPPTNTSRFSALLLRPTHLRTRIWR